MNLTIALIDENGLEVSYPGYERVSCMFTPAGGPKTGDVWWENINPIGFATCKAGEVNVTHFRAYTKDGEASEDGKLSQPIKVLAGVTPMFFPRMLTMTFAKEAPEVSPEG